MNMMPSVSAMVTPIAAGLLTTVGLSLPYYVRSRHVFPSHFRRLTRVRSAWISVSLSLCLSVSLSLCRRSGWSVAL